MTTLVGAGEVGAAREAARSEGDASEGDTSEVVATDQAGDAADIGGTLPTATPEVVERMDVDSEAEDGGTAEFGPPFTPRSFGGELVWVANDTFTSKVLRIRAGEVVLISTKGRSEMVAMLTGGRAVLEVEEEGEIQREEILPGTPTPIHAESAHRIVAMTDVELFTAYVNHSAP